METQSSGRHRRPTVREPKRLLKQLYPPSCARGGALPALTAPQCTWIGAARRGSHDFGLLESDIASPSSPLPQAGGLLAQAASEMGAREMGARDGDAASGGAAGSTAVRGSWHAAVSPSVLRRTSRSGMEEGVCSATRSWRSWRVSVCSAHEGGPRLLGKKAPTRLPRLLASGRRRQTRSSTASGSCSSWTWSVFAPRSSWQSVTGVPTTSNSGGAQRCRLHPSSGASSGKVWRDWSGGLFREAAAVVGVPRGTVRDRGGGVFAGPIFGDAGSMTIGPRSFSRSDESPRNGYRGGETPPTSGVS